MFDNRVLEDPAMAIAPHHDGRHTLPDLPTARESTPYLFVIPEEQIAVIVYTWVSKDSMAGAVLAMFGPGVGPEPIKQFIADRPVPPDMDFDDWRIEGFSLRQDLQFKRGEVSWHTEAAAVDFTFEAFHPPYSYGTAPQGCPSYLAEDRIEQAGTVKGTLRLGTREIAFETTGHRDHSWGTRDWIPFQQYEWFLGQAGPEVGVHFLRYQALGRTHLYGYVFKDGLMSRITALELTVDYDPAFWQTGYRAAITDAAGRATALSGKIFGNHCLVPNLPLSLNEGAGPALIDGRAGTGWIECGWPTAYLEHIRTISARDR